MTCTLCGAPITKFAVIFVNPPTFIAQDERFCSTECAQLTAEQYAWPEPDPPETCYVCHSPINREYRCTNPDCDYAT